MKLPFMNGFMRRKLSISTWSMSHLVYYVEKHNWNNVKLFWSCYHSGMRAVNLLLHIWCRVFLQSNKTSWKCDQAWELWRLDPTYLWSFSVHSLSCDPGHHHHSLRCQLLHLSRHPHELWLDFLCCKQNTLLLAINKKSKKY